jgi:AraC family transcriptional regulator of adaptative response / DNA-3-methyladenine glycosylase II
VAENGEPASPRYANVPIVPLDFDACYRALCARNSRFDGLFFVAVKTTGIYCRPVCPARTPRARSCLFVDTAAAAERAGFRPCLRCRPELAPAHAAAASTPLEHALYAHIQAQALTGHPVAAVAQTAGYSSRQLRRLLVKSYGVTPIEIAQTQRLLFAKKLLAETALPVIDVALSAGFGSLRRFNALFRQRYGLTPSAARPGRCLNGTSAPAADDRLTLRLAYREPLAWDVLLTYLRRRATPRVEHVTPADGPDGGTYVRTLEIGGVTGWVSVCRAAQSGYLQVQVPAHLASVLFTVLHRLRALLDLDADPQLVAAHLGGDARFASLVAAQPGLRVPGAWDVFELAVRAVLGQQVSVAGATTLAGRLAARFGRPLETPFAGVSSLAPAAARLAAAEPAEIAAIGLPQPRARAIRGLAEAALRGALIFPPGTPPGQAVATLRQLPGIGEWTAQYIAMRGLRFPDAFPAGDLGLRKAASRELGTLLSETKVLELAEAWRPWRAYAAQYLWHSLS